MARTLHKTLGHSCPHRLKLPKSTHILLLSCCYWFLVHIRLVFLSVLNVALTFY